ncbi:MAG: FKBP-type peptidyl-prolyl cis-trans isomerase [Candidatus Eisenbacteria bacterium]|nr:FKBP-type peptidyl-prolyl cis-trans isomerase [Candidatus Eisenbacteria bacterium]
MKRPITWLAATVLLGALGCAHGGGSGATGASTPAPAAAPAAPASPAPAGRSDVAKEISLPSGLKYQDLATGDGALAETGMSAAVHYTGWLTDGTKFDSSVDRGQPFTFRLGAGQVIRGWDEGVRGMRVGGKRKLTIPPDLGYGAAGAGGVIPPNATLVFEVELLDAK